MALTKQQKILGAVVALGVAAVGLDQFVLGGGASGPESASASTAVTNAVTSAATTAPPDQAAPPKSPKDAPASSTVITGHPELSDRLEQLASDQSLAVDGMIDAFVPRGAWAQAKPEPPKPQSKPFQERHQLDAVMAVAGEGVAIIDGRTLRLGNLYDGHVLRGISDTSVTFERDGASVTLYLPGAQADR